uniref:Uncharacterized protein n=1 Tax=Rhizophora mucronata TaxID=61149 RepID=A0A2P2NJ93_RHIMU
MEKISDNEVSAESLHGPQ